MSVSIAMPPLTLIVAGLKTGLTGFAVLLAVSSWWTPATVAAEPLPSPIVTSASPEQARLQLECWAAHREGPEPYAGFAKCTSATVAAALVRDFGRAGGFVQQYLGFRLETYRNIDAGMLTLADAQRLREGVLEAERQRQDQLRRARQVQQIQAQGYYCGIVGGSTRRDADAISRLAW